MVLCTNQAYSVVHVCTSPFASVQLFVNDIIHKPSFERTLFHEWLGFM